MSLTKHNLSCPNKHAITHFQPQHSGNKFWFKYKCYGKCKGLSKMTKSYSATTNWNATDKDKRKSLHFLDRHDVQCKNGYSLQTFGLKRKGNSIQYQYKCIETRCSKRSSYNTSPKNMGSNQLRYYPRLLVKIPKTHHVITGFKFQRQKGTDFFYKINYCELNHKFPDSGKGKANTKGKGKKGINNNKGKGKGKKPNPSPPRNRPIPKVTPLPSTTSSASSPAYPLEIPTVLALTKLADVAIKNGNIFCAKHCIVNMARRTRQCLIGGKAYDCKRCVINPMKNDAMINSICENVCDSVGFKRPCEFFGYLNGSRKNVNPAALKKYGLSLIRRR